MSHHPKYLPITDCLHKPSRLCSVTVWGIIGGEYMQIGGNITYSNCRAAICEGKPVTTQTISQGLNPILLVLNAPP